MRKSYSSIRSKFVQVPASLNCIFRLTKPASQPEMEECTHGVIEEVEVLEDGLARALLVLGIDQIVAAHLKIDLTLPNQVKINVKSVKNGENSSRKQQQNDEKQSKKNLNSKCETAPITVKYSCIAVQTKSIIKFKNQNTSRIRKSGICVPSAVKIPARNTRLRTFQRFLEVCQEFVRGFGILFEPFFELT